MNNFAYKLSQRARDGIEGWPEKAKGRFYKALELLCENPESGHQYEENDIWVYKDRSARPHIDIDYRINQELLRVEVQVAHLTYISLEVHVFLSYSRKDREWFEELRQALLPLEHFDVQFWCDKEIVPSQAWFALILEKLSDANAALLLVSEDFLKSEFIREHELGRFLKRAEDLTGEPFILLWVPLASKQVIAVDDLGSRLLKHQALLDPEEPLNRTQSEKSVASTLSELCEKVHLAIHTQLRKNT